jgi:hypothetical protein
MAYLVDWRGRPITSRQPRDEQIDGFQLPDGAVVSKSASFDLHKRIQNDTTLRERLETAQRMTGRKILHLSFMERGNKNITADLFKTIEKNADFGEKVMQKRIKDENLKESDKAYEKLKTA